MNQELRIMGIKNKVKSIGFTLIELLVAISIIGILSSFLLANFIGVRQRARDGVRKSDLRQIQSALELYRSDQSTYPPNTSFSTCGGAFTGGNPVTTYMQKIPCDPSSTASTPISYTYNSISPNTAYTIVACLENVNDPQLDSPKANCTGNTTWKYTLQNP